MNWIFDSTSASAAGDSGASEGACCAGLDGEYGSGPGPPMDELGPAAIPAAAKAARRANSRRDNPVCGPSPVALGRCFLFM